MPRGSSLLLTMSTIAVRTKRWTRLEYERLIDRGMFRADDRLELVDGLLVVKEPQGNPHAAAVDRVVAALREVFGDGWLVRAHAPLALGKRSRPEPDVSVVRGTPGDYSSEAPSDPALVVEISQSSLPFDRMGKASIYARARIADYWIVNLRERVVEVRRGPAAASGRGSEYRSVETLRLADSVAPLAAPNARIAVSDLLPP